MLSVRLARRVPSDWAGDDRWSARCGEFGQRLSRFGGWTGPRLEISVVVCSLGGVAEDGVGGNDLLKCRVGHGLLRLVGVAAGVRVVLAKRCTVGTGDLGLSRMGRYAQDRVLIGRHGERGSVDGGRGPGREGRGHVVRMTPSGPRGVAPLGRGRRKMCVRRPVGEACGRGGRHLVKADPWCVAVTCLSCSRTVACRRPWAGASVVDGVRHRRGAVTPAPVAAGK